MAISRSSDDFYKISRSEESESNMEDVHQSPDQPFKCNDHQLQSGSPSITMSDRMSESVASEDETPDTPSSSRGSVDSTEKFSDKAPLLFDPPLEYQKPVSVPEGRSQANAKERDYSTGMHQMDPMEGAEPKRTVISRNRRFLVDLALCLFCLLCTVFGFTYVFRVYIHFLFYYKIESFSRYPNMF
jgi:hypothetical protein